jgi:hypothetical protein
MMRRRLLILLAAVAPLAAQGPRLQINLDHLKAKAKEYVNVNLDGSMLGEARKLVGEATDGMEGVYVRVLEFDEKGAYTKEDVEALRKQISGPNWKNIIEVIERDESTWVSVYSEGGKTGGFAVISAEPRELTVVNIVGNIDLSRVGKIRGIPHLRMLESMQPKKEEKKKDDE